MAEETWVDKDVISRHTRLQERWIRKALEVTADMCDY